jgi:cholest-4-en-3-one 26-monooxygenase
MSNATAAPEATQIDLTNVDFWVGDPYPTFKWLRDHDPVFRHQPGAMPGAREFWALTKHADVAHVSKNPALFRSGDGTLLYEKDIYAPPAQVQPIDILQMDDPRHRWMRALVSKGFTPNALKRLEFDIRQVAAGILDKVEDMASAGVPIDFVDDLAAQLPAAVVGAMLGVPPEDYHLVKHWTDTHADSGAESRQGTAATAQLPDVAARLAMAEYFRAMQAQRMDHPREDLVSILLTAEVDGEKLTQAEQVGFFNILLIAGNDTTRNTASAGLLALGENPREKARLLNDPSLMPTAVEEMLRWSSPVTYFRRTATEDTELRGKRIRKGDWVAVYYGSANRDEDVFNEPDRFDVGRSPNPHIAFGGGGPHFCLGASLARLELRVLFEELFSRFPEIAVTGEPEWNRSNFFRGFTHLPVSLGNPRRA